MNEAYFILGYLQAMLANRDRSKRHRAMVGRVWAAARVADQLISGGVCNHLLACAMCKLAKELGYREPTNA